MTLKSSANCRPFAHVHSSLTQLSARHASEAGPQQPVREGLQADSQESELHLSARALGNRLACCRVRDGYTGVATAGTHAAVQPAEADDRATGHPGSRVQLDRAHPAERPALEKCQDVLLLARPSGAISESLQVYVLHAAPHSEPAVQLEVRAMPACIPAPCDTPERPQLPGAGLHCRCSVHGTLDCGSRAGRCCSTA